MSHDAVFPELVTGRRDGYEVGEWRVVEGTTLRGGASCNLGERVLEVPLGPDPMARVVRAHELVHVRVSPHRVEHAGTHDDIALRALECAEELRVNTVLLRSGFDVSQLRDGTERTGGRRVGEGNDWAEAVCFMTAVLSTGAERDFLTGVRRVQPTWSAGLREVRKRVLAVIASMTTDELTDTSLTTNGSPRGYERATMLVARILTLAMGARAPLTRDEVRAFRRSLEPGARRARSGRFAPLVFDPSIVMVERPDYRSEAHYAAGVTGTTLRYPSRLLTDDARRAFASRRRRVGGIVLVDQSGSMDIDVNELAALARRAPEALVIGYSHRPGDRGTTPNVWVLAQRGRAAATCPRGNVGNGVDGAVLEWAIGQRRGDEAIVWVTDGQVTDSNDHPDDELTATCARLVRRHRVTLVRDLSGASRVVRRGTSAASYDPAVFGRVGRKLIDIKVFD